jgi:hypothetical protein
MQLLFRFYKSFSASTNWVNFESVFLVHKVLLWFVMLKLNYSRFEQLKEMCRQY